MSKKLSPQDIAEWPPFPSGEKKDSLSEIFDLYKESFKPYKVLENYPDYPINLQTKESQVLLREMVGYICEELWEVKEVALRVADTRSTPGYTKADIVSVLREYNEELADVMHFLIKMFLYSGISSYSVNKYLEHYLKEMNLLIFYESSCALTTSLSYASYLTSMSPIAPTLRTVTPALEVEQMYIRDMDSKFDYMVSGGNKLTHETLQYHSFLIGGVMDNLLKATHELKNKPWKQSEPVSDVNSFHEALLHAWISFAGVLDFSGLDTTRVFSIFWYKNQVNRLRITEKY